VAVAAADEQTRVVQRRQMVGHRRGGQRQPVRLVCLTLLPYLGFALRPGLVWSLLLLLFSGAGAAYTLGLDQWFVQAVPEELRGRAMTLNTAGLMTVQGVGMALAGVAAEFAGVTATVAGAGALGTVCCALLALSARRTQETRGAASRARAPFGEDPVIEARDGADQHMTGR